MNRNFRDARYYLRRTVENALRGVRTEIEPVAARARSLAGREREPTPGRMDRARVRLRRLRLRAGAEVRRTMSGVRRRFRTYRRG